MHRRFAVLAAPLTALSLLLAACGGSAQPAQQQTTDPSPTATTEPTAAPVVLDEGAPALVQTLTDLLDGHVYLASIAVVMGVTNGLDSEQFKAAAATLDQNSQDLAAAIESVYGAEAGEQFLSQWRDHIGFFVQYTEGKATKNDQMATEALDKLSNYKEDFAAFLESATGGELPSDAAAEALQMHVDSLVGAIDKVIAGDPGVFDAVYDAATGHMPHTASALAGAIAAQFPEKFTG